MLGVGRAAHDGRVAARNNDRLGGVLGLLDGGGSRSGRWNLRGGGRSGNFRGGSRRRDLRGLTAWLSVGWCRDGIGNLNLAVRDLGDNRGGAIILKGGHGGDSTSHEGSDSNRVAHLEEFEDCYW